MARRKQAAHSPACQRGVNPVREIQRQVVLVSLVEELTRQGSWSSETHLQKAVYFLQEALNVPLELEFILYKHGPFSFELRELLGEMRAGSVISVRVRPAPYGPSLEPGAAFELLSKSYPKTYRRYARQVEYVANKLAKKDVGELERLGTALYVSREWPELSSAGKAEKIVDLKPHVSDEAAHQAIEQFARFAKAAPLAKPGAKRN